MAMRAIQFNLGLTLLRMGRAKEAIVYLRSASSDSALSDEATPYLMGTAYFQLADYANAAEEIPKRRGRPATSSTSST